MTAPLTTLLALVVTGLAPVLPAPNPDPLALGYLGIRVQDGTLEVFAVESGTPAERAGLQPGDQLVKVGELEPESFAQVAEHISTFRPGSRLRVEVRRAGEARTFDVRLGVRPAELPPPWSRTRLPINEDD